MARISTTRKVFFSGAALLLFLIAGEIALTIGGWGLGRYKAGSEALPPGGTAIVTMGDSVTYGFGLDPHQSWVGQLRIRLEAAQPPVAVQNLARGGFAIHNLEQDFAPALRRTTEDHRVVGLVLLGHNDVLHWAAREANPFPHRLDTHSGIPERGVWTPRVFRVARWMAGIALQEEATTDIPPGLTERYVAGLRAVAEPAHQSGGEVYVLTYPLPGSPNPSQNDAQARLLSKTRAAQRTGNEIARVAAAQAGLPVIDLERDLVMPMQWDDAWFLDNIHPTTWTSGKMTDAVEARLVADGWVGR